MVWVQVRAAGSRSAAYPAGSSRFEGQALAVPHAVKGRAVGGHRHAAGARRVGRGGGFGFRFTASVFSSFGHQSFPDPAQLRFGFVGQPEIPGQGQFGA